MCSTTTLKKYIKKKTKSGFSIYEVSLVTNNSQTTCRMNPLTSKADSRPIPGGTPSLEDTVRHYRTILGRIPELLIKAETASALCF